MSERQNCERCGAVMPAGGTLGTVCPRCLMQLGMEAIGQSPTGQMPTPTVEQIQALLPQFEVLEFVGRGGMGAVYKARQKSLGRPVALKVLLPRAGHEVDFADRFSREARALAGLDHPGLVAVHDFGQAGDFYYLVMEYVDGPSLRQVIASGNCGPADALALVGQICEALQSAHEAGVVHRDIKPENILVDRRGRIKISDFGLAKLLDPEQDEPSLTRIDQVMGTPHYMAPEQVERPKHVDHRADIYSLGVVIYELLTGELPLGNFQSPSRKVQVDVRLDEVVLRALEKEPERRYQSVAHVRTDVDQITDPEADAKDRRGAAANEVDDEDEDAVMEAVRKSLDLVGVDLDKETKSRVILVGGGLNYLSFLLVIAVVVGSAFAIRAWREREAASQVPEVPYIAADGAIGNMGFYDDLKFTAQQIQNFQRLYWEARDAYEVALRAATVGRVEEDGTIFLEIRDFREERTRIEESFHEELSWDLDHVQMEHLRNMNFAGTAFPYGHTPAEIEIPGPGRNTPSVQIMAGRRNLFVGGEGKWMHSLWQKVYRPAPSVTLSMQRLVEWFGECDDSDPGWKLRSIEVRLRDDARAIGQIGATLRLESSITDPEELDFVWQNLIVSIPRELQYEVVNGKRGNSAQQFELELDIPVVGTRERWSEDCEVVWDPLEHISKTSVDHRVALRQVEPRVAMQMAHVKDDAYRIETSRLEPRKTESVLSLLGDLENDHYWASITAIRFESPAGGIPMDPVVCEAVLRVRSGR